MIKTINVKEHMPNSEYGLFLMLQEISFAKKEGNRVLIVIHGYGSHGQGGAIRSLIRDTLKEMKSKAEICDFIEGERWAESAEKVKSLYQEFPSLVLNENLQNLNSGVTVIFV